MVDTTPVEVNPHGVAYDSGNAEVYVNNANSNTVSEIDTKTNTVTSNITVGSYPLGVAYNPDNHYIYVRLGHNSNYLLIHYTTA